MGLRTVGGCFMNMLRMMDKLIRLRYLLQFTSVMVRCLITLKSQFKVVNIKIYGPFRSNPKWLYYVFFETVEHEYLTEVSKKSFYKTRRRALYMVQDFIILQYLILQIVEDK